MNPDQTKFVLASNIDILFVDIKKELEIDIDEQEKVGLIKSCMGDFSYIYILANRKDEKLGFYLLRLDLNDP